VVSFAVFEELAMFLNARLLGFQEHSKSDPGIGRYDPLRISPAGFNTGRTPWAKSLTLCK